MRPDLFTDSDSWLRASWRARPGSFVALMSLYESNRVRLRALLGDVRRLDGRYLSRVQGEADLELVVMEQGAYTTVLSLNNLFAAAEFPDSPSGVAPPADGWWREPGLEIRAYHDADLAEASRLGTTRHHPALGRLERRLPATLDARWRRNILLNKWLEYLADIGHGPGTFHGPR